MTTIELDDMNRQRAGFAEKPRGMWSAWRAARAASRQRQPEKIFLSQLDARLLRDIGIDPADVRDSLNGRSISVLFYPIRRPMDWRFDGE